MDTFQWVLIGWFCLGYAMIGLEEKLKVSKAATALFFGFSMLLAASFYMEGEIGAHKIEEETVKIIAEKAEVVFFLMAAMALVLLLTKFHLFSWIRYRIYKKGWGNRTQTWVLLVLAALSSAIIDNMTAALVSWQIACQFFRGSNLTRVAIGLIIAANAGGAPSPIGDVTTFMIWRAGKVDGWSLLSWGLLPNLTIVLVAILGTLPFIRNGGHADDDTVPKAKVDRLPASSWLIISLTFLTFLTPLILGQYHRPAYFGLAMGFGLVWMIAEIFRIKPVPVQDPELDTTIKDDLGKIDVDALKFFLGILAAAGALRLAGILSWGSGALYGATPTAEWIIACNVMMGAISAVLDNVPLTAIAIDLVPTTSKALWSLLATAVGNGGSMLIIGSAAGVVLMGKAEEAHRKGVDLVVLTFHRYLLWGTPLAVIAYLAGIGVTYLQYLYWGFPKV